MTLIRLPLILVFVALLAACSDNQKAAETKRVTVQKELTPKEKFAKVQKEAVAGNARAQYDLSVMYYEGEGVPKDVAKTMEWLHKAAAQGFADAQNLLGVAYAHGKGVPKDAAKAVEWFLKAAAQGNANAQFMLGWMYAFVDGVPKDAAKAFEWWKRAAAQGHTDAQFRLGWAYAGGFGVPADAAKELEWFQKAAAQGNADAQIRLGRMYWYGGRGVPKDAIKALELYHKAAAAGEVYAQIFLGNIYAEGDGVPKDAAKAFEWFQKAAAQGNADAQSRLGWMYWTGEGVGKNVILAYAWQNLASVEDSGSPAAPAPSGKGPEAPVREVRDAMEARLNPAQRAEGQRLSSNWKQGDILQVTGESNPSASAPLGTLTKQGTGTGFVVSNSGHALTNYHVIDGCKEIRAAGQDAAIKVVTSDTVNDLTLLQMPGKSNAATLTDNPAKLRQGEDIVVYGYPLNSVLSSGGNLTPGTVSALSGLGNNTNQIQITAPIQPGSSGSPVLDKKGNVVGVVSMKLSDSKMARVTGSVGQNVNFAVNGQTVKAFLDTNKVSYKTGGGFFSREKSNADIAEEARKWTVVLECWR